MSPILSIITATYNNEKTLEETIQSVLDQDFTNFEYILVDGDSKDNTLNIIKKYEPVFQERKITYKWLSERDTGIYQAWNKGLRLANGHWIAFLGSDDTYTEGALKNYAIMAERNPEVDFIHSIVKLINGSDVRHTFSEPWKWKNFKRYMKIAHVGAFHNKNYFEKYGVFNEEYKIAGDYELLLRAKSNLKTIFLNTLTAEMKDGGVSNDNVLAAFKEARKAKITTAQIPKSVAFFDFYFNLSKYYVSTAIKKMLS